MSRENVEVIRRIYEAAAQRDSATIFSLYDPDVEWDGSRSRWAEILAGEARWRGHDELRSFFRRYYEIWEDFEDDVQELIDAGDQVISVVNSRGRGRVSGLNVEWSGNAGLWTLRGGRVVRVVWFPSRDEALDAAGVPSDQV